MSLLKQHLQGSITSMSIDQALRYGDNDSTGNLTLLQALYAKFLDYGFLETSTRDTIRDGDPPEKHPVRKASKQTTAIQQDWTFDLRSRLAQATSQHSDAAPSIPTPVNRLLYKSHTTPENNSIVSVNGVADLGQASLACGFDLLSPSVDDTSGNNVLSDGMVPANMSVELSKPPPLSAGPRRVMKRFMVFQCDSLGSTPNIVERVMSSIDTSSGGFSPSPVTSPSDSSLPSSGRLTATHLSRPLPLAVILASMFRSTMAFPVQDADGSLSTASGTPILLYVACAVTVGTGILGFCLTRKHESYNLSWRNCLGALSLMASVVWACLDHWNKAPDFRMFVPAFGHALIYNFTLQSCYSEKGRFLLPESRAIVFGFPAAALLLDSLESLRVVAPTDQEAVTAPTNIVNSIASYMLRWMRSPLEFTTWVILVKVTFHAYDALVYRHVQPHPTTLLGRLAVRVASTVEASSARLFLALQKHCPAPIVTLVRKCHAVLYPTSQEQHAEEGMNATDGLDAGMGTNDNSISLNEQAPGNDQAMASDPPVAADVP